MSPSRKTTKCSIYRNYFKRSEGKQEKKQKAISIEQTHSTQQSKNNNKKIHINQQSLLTIIIITTLQTQKLYRHFSKLKYVSILPQGCCWENTSARVFHKGITKQQSISIKKGTFPSGLQLSRPHWLRSKRQLPKTL